MGRTYNPKVVRRRIEKRTYNKKSEVRIPKKLDDGSIMDSTWETEIKETAKERKSRLKAEKDK